MKNLAKKIINLAFEVALFILRSDILHAVKSFGMRPLASLPLWRRACCGFLSALKIYRLDRV
jgi:hypothetical protein